MTDAHRVVFGHTAEPGCWAGDSEYATCGARAVSDLGLCGPHLAELRGDDGAAEPADGHHATFAVTDETAIILGVDPASVDVAVVVDGRYAGTVGELQARGYAW